MTDVREFNEIKNYVTGEIKYRIQLGALSTEAIKGTRGYIIQRLKDSQIEPIVFTASESLIVLIYIDNEYYFAFFN